ncbi:MAG: methionyl-tRNA formyltransferase [Brevinematia bacterium]
MKKVCYFGSGEFSKAVLEGLLHISCDYKIDFVVTKSDKEKGRGRVLSPTPVKELAISNSIEFTDNENIRSQEFFNLLSSKGFDLFIVCDYGKIIPREIFEMPPMKTVGIHPSLLPKYRGPSPIHFALLNCDKVTGTTIFYINEKMDAGEILLQKEVEIDEDDDYSSLKRKLTELSIELIARFFENPNITPVPQEDSLATFTKIIRKEDSRIDWSKEARHIFGQVRAFVEWPKAYCFYKGRMVKILKARYSEEETSGDFGEVIRLGDRIGIKTGRGVLEVEKLLPENSKVMDAKSFVNGYRVKVGDKFE